MKTAVRVRLVATHDVMIIVEHEPGESPTDLTPEEEQRAIGKGESCPAWEIDHVEEMKDATFNAPGR